MIRSKMIARPDLFPMIGKHAIRHTQYNYELRITRYF